MTSCRYRSQVSLCMCSRTNLNMCIARRPLSGAHIPVGIQEADTVMNINVIQHVVRYISFVGQTKVESRDYLYRISRYAHMRAENFGSIICEFKYFIAPLFVNIKILLARD